MGNDRGNQIAQNKINKLLCSEIVIKDLIFNLLIMIQGFSHDRFYFSEIDVHNCPAADFGLLTEPDGVK